MGKKHKSVKEYRVWNHTYGFELSIFLTDSMQEFIDNIYPGDSYMEHILNYAAVSFLRNGNVQRVVFERPGLTFGIVAHEAKHLVNLVFDHICMQLDPNNDEAECYFLQWVVNHIHQALYLDGTKINPSPPSQPFL